MKTQNTIAFKLAVVASYVVAGLLLAGIFYFALKVSGGVNADSLLSI